MKVSPRLVHPHSWPNNFVHLMSLPCALYDYHYLVIEDSKVSPGLVHPYLWPNTFFFLLSLPCALCGCPYLVIEDCKVSPGLVHLCDSNPAAG